MTEIPTFELMRRHRRLYDQVLEQLIEAERRAASHRQLLIESYDQWRTDYTLYKQEHPIPAWLKPPPTCGNRKRKKVPGRSD